MKQNMATRAADSKRPVILAANQRLARYLAGALYAESLPAREINIHPLGTWIGECWREAQDLAAPGADTALLDDDQEIALWREITDGNLAHRQLINSDGIIDALAEARAIIDGWSIPAREIDQYALPETIYLQQCLSGFRATLAERQLITREQCLRLLADYFDTGIFHRLDIIYLYGFTDMPPLLRNLLDKAARMVKTLPPPDEKKSISLAVTKAPNVKKELVAAASWCGEKLARQPDSKIGVIVPGLESLRHQVEQIFIEQFDAGYFSNPASNDTQAPFDISIGVPLAEVPIIGAALDLFDLPRTELDHSRVLSLFRSPFWGNGVDLARMRLLGQLTQWPERKYRVSAIREMYRQAETPASVDAENASARLVECASLARRHSASRNLAAWVEPIKTFLNTAGWPGPRSLNSVEYQAVQRFLDWLDSLPGYNNVITSTYSFTDALTQIRSLLKREIFHPQTPRVPIQVMGLMEGAGMTFDYCWLVGMSSDNIPAAPRPNAFIPIQLQKKYATPRCSAERELAYANSLIASYRTCASEVVFSYSNSGENESARISPLLRDIEQHAMQCVLYGTSEIARYLTQCALHNNYQFYCDDSAPVLQSDEFGGISHIKLHNANPLYAFLYHRLNAEDIQAPCLGMHPATRGVIIHLVLARFWREIKTSETLQQLDDLDARLKSIIDAVISTYDLSSLSAAEINQEKQRTREVIGNWLRWEAGRPAFSVTGIEEKMQFTLSGMEMSLRIDRIDQLADGETLLIDYKTGTTALNGLQALPLRDPQLPVYALSMNTRVNAVAYAEINRGNTGFKGIGALNGGPAGILNPAQLKSDDAPDNWSELVEWWRADLERSLEEITTGYCPCVTHNPAEVAYYSFLMPVTREQEQATDFE